MTTDLRLLNAVLVLADRELAKTDWQDRTGALRALLSEAVPFLKQLRDLACDEVTA